MNPVLYLIQLKSGDIDLWVKGHTVSDGVGTKVQVFGTNPNPFWYSLLSSNRGLHKVKNLRSWHPL